jgi:hypothetical protein
LVVRSFELKGTYLGLGIFGILLILFGTVFALQGDGLVGGSSMTGVPFWIYAGSGIIVVGLVIAFAGFYLGSKKKSLGQVKTGTMGAVDTPPAPSP